MITIYFQILHLWRVVWRQNYFCESIKMNQPVISIQNVYLRVLHKSKFQLVGLSESADYAEWLFLAIKTLFNIGRYIYKKINKKKVQWNYHIMYWKYSILERLFVNICIFITFKFKGQNALYQQYGLPSKILILKTSLSSNTSNISTSNTWIVRSSKSGPLHMPSIKWAAI